MAYKYAGSMSHTVTTLVHQVPITQMYDVSISPCSNSFELMGVVAATAAACFMDSRPYINLSSLHSYNRQSRDRSRFLCRG